MEAITTLERLNQTMEIECLSKSTKKAYVYHIKKWLNYHSNDQTQENIIKHLFYLRKYNKSPEYIAVARASLLYYFNKILCKPITIRIENPKRKKGLLVCFINKLITSLDSGFGNLKHRVMLELIYDTGLRRGEVSRLKWYDVDLINGQLRVNQSKGRKDRLIGLGKSITQHLLDLKDTSPKDNDYIFWSQERKGYHISDRTVGAIFKNISKKAGLNHIVRPHSFATHSLEGTDIRVIQELLGHSSPKTTMIYGIEKAKFLKNKMAEIVRNSIIKRLKNQEMPYSNTKIERKIARCLKTKNIEFESQFSIDNKFVCDFAIPSYKLIIECDGDYWHGNPCIYNQSNLGKIQLKNIRRDIIKDKYVKSKGWNILHFFETDINKNIDKCLNQIEQTIKVVV